MNESMTALIVLLSVVGRVHAASEPHGEITVYVDQPTVVLPNVLYGLFYEDINYSGDGGLYAELVQNRSFEYYPVSGWNPLSDKMTPLFAWEKVENGGGACELSVESTEPLNKNNTQYVGIYMTRGNPQSSARKGTDECVCRLLFSHGV